MDLNSVPELRLLLTLVLTGLAIWTCWKWVRFMAPFEGTAARLSDVILWYSGLVAVIITGLGWLGLLRIIPMTLTVMMAAVLSAWIAPIVGRNHAPVASKTTFDPAARAAWIIASIAGGVVLAAVVVARTTPPLATDALVYHLALPARWIQDARISVVPLWFHNPGNSYSPLHASCLLAWFMLPMGNDVLARFALLPHLLLCGLSLYALLRRAGVSPFVASATAAACCLSRSFLAEALQLKDDVVLTAYFLAAIAALDPGRLVGAYGSLRAGLAVGLLLATKYPALLVMPIVILSIVPALLDKTTRRRLLWVAVPVLVVAAPWYLRNFILTGSPIFPVAWRIGNWTFLHGLFATTVAPADRTLGSLIHVLVGTSRFSVRWWLMVAMVIMWAWGWVVCWRTFRQYSTTLCLTGPPLLLLVFFVFWPDREVRYLIPMIGLLFGACGLAIGQSPVPFIVRKTMAGGLLVASVLTGTVVPILSNYVVGAASGVVALTACNLAASRWRTVHRYVRLGAYTLAGFVAFALIYVWWGNGVDRCRMDYRALWSVAYGPSGLGSAWDWLDRNAAPGDTIAYTGTPMTYPLMGFDWSRRAVYTPVEPHVDDFTQLPPIDQPLTGSEIVSRTAALYRGKPSRDYWLDHVARQSVRYLLTTPFGDERPVEDRWANESDQFRLAYRSGRTSVYAINPPSTHTTRK